jgi:hypothetical protein
VRSQEKYGQRQELRQEQATARTSNSNDNIQVVTPFGLHSCLRQRGRPLRGGLIAGTKVPAYLKSNSKNNDKN